MSPEPGTITQLLIDYGAGDPNAMERLMPMVYRELRHLAGRALRRERRDHTINATALVHEAFLRMVDQRSVQWKHRSQFLAIAAQTMRRILVDHARNRAAAKRGGGAAAVSLLNHDVAAQERPLDIQALDEALIRLASLDALHGSIVELRFFGGLTVEETAEVLNTSPATIKREWTLAKAWLRREIEGGGEETKPMPRIT